MAIIGEVLYTTHMIGFYEEWGDARKTYDVRAWKARTKRAYV